MAPEFPSPTVPADTRAEVFLRYLDFLRAQVVAKLTALDPQAQQESSLPSGWSPRELLHHLTHVERRWLVWGFLGTDVDDPWADETDGRWQVGPDVDVVAASAAQAATTRAIVTAHDLDELGRPSDRWDGAAPPTLERVLFHLLQEYARHLGQLDVVVELAGGPLGE